MSLEDINVAIAQLSQDERECLPDESREERRDRQLAAMIHQGQKEFGPLVGSPRPSGLCAGRLAVPDDFDAPLPEEILRLFEDGPVFPGDAGARDVSE